MLGSRLQGLPKQLSQWAIADDSGLEVRALGGAPGIYSARYADSDQARIERLLQELAGCGCPVGASPGGDRSAQFVCALALANPAGEIVLGDRRHLP
jgi:XTP/dITP diphosphohydrolase